MEYLPRVGIGLFQAPEHAPTTPGVWMHPEREGTGTLTRPSRFSCIYYIRESRLRQSHPAEGGSPALVEVFAVVLSA
jgi:hypothetical protein